jgi:hypothetical protein
VTNNIPVWMASSNYKQPEPTMFQSDLCRKYISLDLTELRYMMYMFHVVLNQEILYFRALSDVITYAHAAHHSTVYVEPATSANKSILYPQLYEELRL